MRLALVSAHYPPDFVSGGTLVPARLAQRLRQAGHDVRVFAGHLGPGRRALEEWDEVVDGVPVRWISVAPYTDWAGAENADNPGAARAFRRWLQEHPADVVHLHSLQTLGGGLVPAARDSGARVVVTMHDFWWVCGRQFLVSPDSRPCCLVVDCGVCPCEVDAAWLHDRDARLRDQLAAADVVLAPSRSAARVLAANGVDGARLRVDENGLPEPLPAGTATPRPDGAPLRLLFTGGRDALKGLPVLRRALARLADLPGWQLTAYGVEPADLEAPGLPVRALPAFRPAQLPEVLAAADVLVLPSLMRESHSLVTREALAAGLAVVCTDTLGPEEAVSSGTNGLVVPAGDDLVLAEALRGLVEDPAEVARLRAAGLLTPLRSLDEQVAGLQDLYAELLEAPPAPAPLPRVRSVVFAVGIDGAPLRYRARLPAEGLALQGVHTDVVHYRDPALPALAAAADAVVLYRVPATPQVLALAQAVRERPEPVPLLFDVDDLIFDPSVRAEVRGIAHLPPDEVELWWQGVRRYRTTLEQCDAYVGSTECSAGHAAEVDRHAAPSASPTASARCSPGRRTPRCSARAPPARCASATSAAPPPTTTTGRRSSPPSLEVLRRHPDAELWLGGHLTVTPALAPVADRVRRLPFLAWDRLPGLLRDLDVNLAPLELGSRFNEAKSAIKWLEAALVATPTVASPSQPFREAVDPGANGLLAAGEQEWVDALDRLLGDVALRRRLGDRARRDALLSSARTCRAGATSTCWSGPATWWPSRATAGPPPTSSSRRSTSRTSRPRWTRTPCRRRHPRGRPRARWPGCSG